MSKWPDTSFTRRLGVAYPIIQGPFGRGSSSVRLMRAVSNAGDNVDIPVIAAGGNADGRGVAASLILGADAAQIGTAFLACEECGAHPL